MQFKFRPSVELLDARDLPSSTPLDPLSPTLPPTDPTQQCGTPNQSDPTVANVSDSAGNPTTPPVVSPSTNISPPIDVGADPDPQFAILQDSTYSPVTDSVDSHGDTYVPLLPPSGSSGNPGAVDPVVNPAISDPPPVPKVEPLPTADTLAWKHYKVIKLSERPAAYATANAITAYKLDPVISSKYESAFAGRQGTDRIVTTKILAINSSIFKPVFSLSEAWVTDDVKLADDEGKILLEHERLHLRMAEYIATKAAANFPERAYKNLTARTVVAATVAEVKAAAKVDMDLVADQFIDDYQKKWKYINLVIQRKYDAETKSGTDPDKQAKWQERYKEYADETMANMGCR